MAERIKIIADQAHAETYKLYLDRLSKEFAGDVIFYDMFNQRFAELIIRECADIAALNQHQYDSVDNYVLKHFGVK